MTIPFWQRPWLDGAREFYEADNEPDDWSGYTDDLDDEDEDWLEAPVDAIPFPEADEHDRRFMDLYDTKNGDSGENEPPF